MTSTGETPITGHIFDIQRFSIHDGPGIRTTVFMKGCPLSCIWCHNLEGITSEPQISFLPDRCVGCRYCAGICPHGAHRTVEGAHVLDRDVCEVCGECTKECYAKALEFVGRTATVDEVLEEVARDQPFYETSGGGMTLSGGEPTLQIAFTTAILEGARKRGIHRAVETCLLCPYEKLDGIRSLVDLFLCDWKETDPDRHKAFTGADNRIIRENLLRLDAAGASILLRCPIVPGHNDREDHFAGIADLARQLKHLESVELMPYHRLGDGKRERFGMSDRHVDAEPPSPEQVATWKAALAAHGVTVL